MAVIQRGETTAALRRIPFRLIATADDSAMTEADPTVYVRKNYGTASEGAGDVVELGSGLYYYQAAEEELDTLGVLTIEPSAEGAYSLAYDAYVVDYAPTSAGIEAPENFSNFALDSSGRVLLQPTQAGVTIPTVTTVTDGAKSTALATVDSVVDAIKAVTDNLPDSGALTSISSAISGLNDLDSTAVQTAVSAALTAYSAAKAADVTDAVGDLNDLDSAAVQAAVAAALTAYEAAKSSDVTSAVANLATAQDVSDAQTAIIAHGDSNWTGAGSGGDSAGTIAEAVRTELSPELGRIDVAISSRLAASGYTAPDNDGITAARSAAESVDAKLTADRLAQLDKELSTFDPAADPVVLDTSQEIIAGVTMGDLLLGKVSIVADGDGGITVSDADGTEIFAGSYQVNEDGTVSVQVAT